MNSQELSEAIQAAYKMAVECAPQNNRDYSYVAAKAEESPLHKPTLEHFVKLLEIQARLAGVIHEQN